MERRDFLKQSAAVAGGMVLTGSMAQASTLMSNNAVNIRTGKRPNIILIMADDMGFSDVGCYGASITQTPNLDSLGNNGIRFSHFYNGARCCSSRAALLSGLYAHQAGMGWQDVVNSDTLSWGPAYNGTINNSCVTIAEALKPAGYSNYMLGKWHLTSAKSGSSMLHPMDRGFDRFYGIINGAANYFAPAQLQNDRTDINNFPEDYYFTNAISDKAVDYIDQHDSSNPFFMYMAYTAPHWPLNAFREDFEKYIGKFMGGWDQIRQDRYQKQLDMGIIKSEWGLSPRDSSVAAWDSRTAEEKFDSDMRMAIYAAQMEVMDRGIGKIVDKLKALGQFDDTLIMFISDNGGCAEYGTYGSGWGSGEYGQTDNYYCSYGKCWANTSNTPFKEYKHYVHEGGISSPLIAHWPAMIKQRQVTYQVGHIIDILATCVDAAEVQYPTTYNDHAITPLEGKSLLPIFKGRQRAGHDAIFWEHECNRAVRQGNWKIVSKSGSNWELYNMDNDRSELNNLAGSNTQRVNDMEALYNAWRTKVGARC